ncbi:alpha/beta fold hydrolase [Myxococcota bacterium]|jgi:polyhydroxyalkanoate synthase|nr:alpha/beta fold hydrolase [Myxococcota bacterium]
METQSHSAFSPFQAFGEAVQEAARRMVPIELRGHDAPGGHTPYDVVATRGPVRLLYYAPRGERRFKTPLLIAYSLINRYYILDFMPGRSLIEYLTGQGHACYVIDWGVPTNADRYKTWGDYTLGYLGMAVRTIKAREGVEKVHLYGYCMGGTMAMSYAALRPEGIASFTAMAVPVDFHEGGVLAHWTQPKFFNVDALVDAHGNVPTWLMESGFRFMAPLNNVTKWRDLWENRESDGFVDTWRQMERWSADNVPFPGEVYRQYIRDCYQKNIFCRSEMVVDGERVDLKNITCPVLVVLAEKDNIVPERMAMAITEVVGSDDVTVRKFATGHIGLSSSSKAPKAFWPAISQWLAARDE